MQQLMNKMPYDVLNLIFNYYSQLNNTFWTMTINEKGNIKNIRNAYCMLFVKRLNKINRCIIHDIYHRDIIKIDVYVYSLYGLVDDYTTYGTRTTIYNPSGGFSNTYIIYAFEDSYSNMYAIKLLSHNLIDGNHGATYVNGTYFGTSNITEWMPDNEYRIIMERCH